MDEGLSGSDGNLSDEGETMDTQMKNLVRQSADGGSTQSLGTAASGEDTSKEEDQEDNQGTDLDKDIDSMAEGSAMYCQVAPNASVSIGSIPADSTLNSTDVPEVEERVLDGAPSDTSEVTYSDMDMNGNQVLDDCERQMPIMGEGEAKLLESVSSERSFTSEYSDSSALAESVVRKVLDKAVHSVRMPGPALSPNITGSEASLSSSATGKTIEESSRNQVQDSGEKRSPAFEDDEDYPSDDNDVVRDPDSERKPVEPGDVKVGLFQYIEADMDEYDSDRVRSPENSDIEETVNETMESMTEAEKENILKMYGLEGMDPVSPKSASPSDSENFKIDIADLKAEEESGEGKVYRDIQREVYEPQSRKFSVNRDPSSSESTPRYDSARQDEIYQNNHQRDAQFEVDAERDLSKPVADWEDNAEMEDVEHEEEEGGIPAENERNDTAAADVSQTVSPPLVHYESIKENGKFRIIKMPANYSGIVDAGDSKSPKLSPRDADFHEGPRGQGAYNLGRRQPEVEYDRQGAGPDCWQDIGVTQAQDRKRTTDDMAKVVSGEHGKKGSEKVKSGDTDREFELPNKESASRADVSKNCASKRERQSPVEQRQSSPPQRDSPTQGYISYANKNMGMPPSPPQQKVPPKPRPDTSSRMSPSELEPVPPARSRDRSDVDAQRIKYTTTRDTSGRETKRTGPLPYEVKPNASDPMLSDSRFLEIDGTERRDDVPYDKERYAEPHAQEKRRDPTAPLSQSVGSRRYPATYEQDLIRSAYDRVAQRTGEAALSASLPARTRDTGVIPGYRTLQEQQANWSAMFRTLEEQHRRDLHSQYEHHQYNIQRLQQQMELELQKQHLAIRRKLDLHKEALEHSSLEMEALGLRGYPDRSRSPAHRSPERSTIDQSSRSLSADRISRTPERSERSSLVRSPERTSPDRSADRSAYRTPERAQDRSTRSRSHDRSGSYSCDIEAMQSEIDTRSWREIYNEVRAEEDHLDGSHGNQRSPRSQPSSRSPRVQTTPKERSQRSFDMHENNQSGSRDVDLRLDLRSRSPDGQASRSQERYGSMRTDTSPKADRLNHSGSSTRGRDEAVSAHVQELLHSLDDSRTSLRSLEGEATPTRQKIGPARNHGDQGVDPGLERPRAGVYSSPMPMFHGKGTKSDRSSPIQRRNSPDKPVYNSTNEISSIRSPRSADQSKSPSRPHDYAEFHKDSKTSSNLRETTNTSFESVNASMRDTQRSDESYLSYSSRMNLREKHSKHLADLRAYYEDELRELRQALSESLDTTAVTNDTAQSAVQNHLLEAENRHLLDKCRTMEDEIEELHARIRTLEQKNHGVEKRASEYSGALADMQAMSIQHKAHIEELQRYCRERDDLVNDLESKVRSNEDSVKIYKKSLEEEMELHRQDKINLQRIVDKYESLEREYKLLQETMNTTENKLYETRTEIVELNRTMSKLELENKRLGRENDNLRHKVTQSLNLSALHESFGSPSSPRNRETVQQPIRTKSQSLPANQMQESVSPDQRMPGFAVSTSEWLDSQKSKTKGSPSSSSKTQSRVQSSTPVRQTTRPLKDRSDSDSASQKGKKPSRENPKKPQGETSRRQTDSSENASSREDVSTRPAKPQSFKSDVPTRDITPERPDSPASGAESEVSDYSPLLKAERELFKLRDMMRQAVAIKPSAESPPQPKLQKKYYGSERPTSKDDYTPDLGPTRGRKEKSGSGGSHKSVAKTKSATTHSLADKSSNDDKMVRDKRSQSGRSAESSKSKDATTTGKNRDRGQRKNKDSELDQDRMKNGEATGKTSFGVNTEDFSSSTRFDINVDEKKKSVTLTPRKENQSGRQRAEPTETQSVNGERQGTSAAAMSQGSGRVDNTLDMMRSGQFTTRPQWEDLYTSMAQGRQSEGTKQPTKESTIKDRLRTISEMESRYDGLQIEKRQLESSINKIPLHGRVDRHNRAQKEEMEDRLDQVEKELGSLRMSLKRYNVLKTAG